jgi:hypothetical protein
MHTTERRMIWTYSLGLFLGPGFPLGFRLLSGVALRPLLAPGFGPGRPFRRSAAEGAAAGVEAASEALSTEDAAGAGSAAVDEGEEGTSSFLRGEPAASVVLLLARAAAVLLFLLLSFVSGIGANFFRRLDESLRTTTNLEVAVPLERPLEREFEDIVSSDGRGENANPVDNFLGFCNFFFPSLALSFRSQNPVD